MKSMKSGVVRMLSCILVAFSATVAFCDEYAEPVYYVTNPGGSTSNALSECVFTCYSGGVESASTYAAFNMATAGTLVKRGAGWITVEEDHDAFVGDVHVEAGVLCCRATNGLGYSTASTVKVHDGATLYMDSPSTTLASTYRRKLVLEGAGAADMDGALHARYGKGTGDSNWPFLYNPTLSGDSTIAIDAPSRLLFMSYWLWPDVAAHTLRLKGVAKTRPVMESYATFRNTSQDPGEVILDNLEFRLRDANPDFLGSSANILSVTNKSRVIFAVTGGNREWTLKLDDTRSIDLYNGSSMSDDAATNMVIAAMNKWQGPVVLNCDLPLRKWDEPSKRFALSLLGPVGGKGGIRSFDSTDNSRKLVLNLANADNTFEGGVSLDASSLFLHATTALPADGGALVLTNGVLGLAVAGEFALPDCEFSGNSRVIGVAGASGQAKGITKSGAGTLDCDCILSAEKLDVRGGTYRQSPFSWSCVAGLSVYSNSYTKANYDAADPEMTYIGTQTALLATRMNNAFWGNDTTSKNKMFVYRGYMWNRGDSDVTWTFALAADDGAFLVIDGQEIVRNTRYNAKTATVTLTPGAHSFELRIWNDTGYRGALDYDLITTFDGNKWSYEGKVVMPVVDGVKRSDLGSWHGDRGFMYKVGEPTYFDTDYAFPTDPGDGSLFTTTTNETDIAALAPQYDEAVFASGTTLDVNGWPTVVKSLKGLPAVVNGDLTISEEWTIPVSEVVAGGCLTVSGKLNFGESASVRVDNPALLHSATKRIAVRANGGVTIPQSLEDAPLVEGGKYVLRRISPTELSIEHAHGFMLIFR